MPSRSDISAAKSTPAFAEDRAGAYMAGAVLDDAGQAEADRIDFVERQTGIDDAAAHAVLDQVGDDADRLPVDANRRASASTARRRGNR